MLLHRLRAFFMLARTTNGKILVEVKRLPIRQALRTLRLSDFALNSESSRWHQREQLVSS